MRSATYDAVLFDLDGVLTPTAALHAACWKQTFDPLLAEWGRRAGTCPEPFDAEHDYLTHVDGKLRDDGVRDFLRARGIAAPEAGPDGPPESGRCKAIGRRKQALVERRPERRRHRGVPRARSAGCASCATPASGPPSSRRARTRRRCCARRASTRSSTRPSTVATSTRLGLTGKPAPDGFLEAARRLAVAPANAVVVEDALAGVAAGRAGGFGLVIGVARRAAPAELRSAGADIVVADLAEMLP